MTWTIGIDEAGYGPNLGPLVMTAVAFQVPEPLAGGNLWHLLKDGVRRHSEPDDGRLVVDDSKLVYSTSSGLGGLEAAVWSVLQLEQSKTLSTLDQYVDWICPTSCDDLRRESWYTGKTNLPLASLELGDRSQETGDRSQESRQRAVERFKQSCRDCFLQVGPIKSVVVCPPRFNRLLNYWDSKGAILGQGLKDLLSGQLMEIPGSERIEFVIDKHGGRNCYFAMLQEALGEGMVVAHEEGMNRSLYSVWGASRVMRFIFQPRADADHFCVALASMASKYLRELLMLEFNSFWKSHVPDLKATAGYPGDAARFFKKIMPVAKRLGIPKEAIWRRK